MPNTRIADIIGPIMIGPSSSHTAGALRIASMARRLCETIPSQVEFKLYGSFAHTYRGHGTDRALCGGMLGMEASDPRIRDSLEIAASSDMNVIFTPLPDAEYDHPNTVEIIMTTHTGMVTEVRGVSLGGGAAALTQINGIDVSITGECTSLIVRQRDIVGVLAHITQSISHLGGNIATMRCYRERRGQIAYTVLEVDGSVPAAVVSDLMSHPGIQTVRIIPAEHRDESNEMVCATENAEDIFRELDFTQAIDLLDYCDEEQCTIAQAWRKREQALCAMLGESVDLDSYLDRVFDVMRTSATDPLHNNVTTMGGLIGGESRAVTRHAESGRSIISGPLARVTAYAMAVLETNASMGCIVAAPTAGSSGVLPAVLLALDDEFHYSSEEIRDALICAAAVGSLIVYNATVSGAEGGCQAEIGSAAAMAAAAACQLAGGTPDECFAAASNAIANMLGLVCDPIAGLVEVPCQKRNASGAANALLSAEIALSGVENLVNFDQTVEALHKVGNTLPFELRESALGGMAACPSACDWCDSFRCSMNNQTS